MNESLQNNLSFTIKSVLEPTRHEAMKSASSVLLYRHCVQSVTNGHFVSSDLFVHYLNWMDAMSKMAVNVTWGTFIRYFVELLCTHFYHLLFNVRTVVKCGKE